MDGKEVARKPLTLVADPQVMLTAEQRVAYNALATELPAAQQAGAARGVRACGANVAPCGPGEWRGSSRDFYSDCVVRSRSA